MKKIISFILSIAILMSISVSFVSAQTVVYSDAENFALAVGLVDGENYSSNSYVTRAEYAEMIARLCMLKTQSDSYEEWYNRVFGKDNKDEQIGKVASSVFEDVDPSLEQLEAINIVYSNGYMKGLTETHFGPNYDITFAAVVKVLVHMAGYTPVAERNGGYPGGYISVAGSLGITDGVKAAYNSFVTYKQCCEMFYNIIDVKMMDLVYAEGGGKGVLGVVDETFLTAVLNLYRMDAVVEDNGMTSLTGNTQISKNAIKIGGIVMDATGCDYARSYLGKNVAAFYKKVDGIYELVYAFPVRNSEIVIKAENFISFDGDSFKYYDEKGNEKTTQVSCTNIIYNNKLRTSYTEDTFKFPYGDITLISTNSGRTYDLVVVRDYMVGKVKKISAESKTIYTDTHYTTMTGVKSIDLSGSDKKVLIYDVNGKDMEFSEIEKDDILSVLKSEDGKCIEIWVSDMNISGYVISDYSEDTTADSIYFSDGKTTYSMIGKSKIAANEFSVTLGATMSLYFDVFGNLVWIEDTTVVTGDSVGFVTGTDKQSKGFGDYEYSIRLYTSDSKMVIYPIAEKVSFNKKTKKTQDIGASIEGLISEVIRYKLDENGEYITSITTPLGFGELDTDNRGWYYVKPEVDLIADAEDASKKMTYNDKGSTFGYNRHKAFLFHEKSATFFTTPVDIEDYSDIKKFSATSPTFADYEKKVFNAYSTDPQDLSPDFFAMAGEAISGEKVSVYNAFVITSIGETIDEDGKPMKVLNGYNMKWDESAYTMKKLYLANGVKFMYLENLDAGAESAKVNDGTDSDIVAAYGPGTVADLGVGDIIRYSNPVDGQVNAIQLAYDASAKKSYSFGYAGVTEVGYPAYTSGNYLRFVTDINKLKNNSYGIEDCGVATIEPNNIIVIEKSGNRDVLRPGTPDDIITYEDSGRDDINRIVVIGNHQYTVGIFVYK